MTGGLLGEADLKEVQQISGFTYRSQPDVGAPIPRICIFVVLCVLPASIQRHMPPYTLLSELHPPYLRT